MIQYKIPLVGLKQSTNKIYAGVHWTKRKEFKDEILNNAWLFCRPIRRVESYPVEICYHFSFASRALDTTNCSYMVKCYEDALNAIGVIKDDSPQYITRTIIEVTKLPKEKKAEDYLIITINKI